jgi:hypothetical protein
LVAGRRPSDPPRARAAPQHDHPALDGCPDIARLATVLHGDAALALGFSGIQNGVVEIRPVNALPIGVNQDIESNLYLEPDKHFHDSLFEGIRPDGPDGVAELRQPGGQRRPDHRAVAGHDSPRPAASTTSVT